MKKIFTLLFLFICSQAVSQINIKDENSKTEKNLKKTDVSFTLSESFYYTVRGGCVSTPSARIYVNGDYTETSQYNGRPEYGMAITTGQDGVVCIGGVLYYGVHSYIIRWSGLHWDLGFIHQNGPSTFDFRVIDYFQMDVQTLSCVEAFHGIISGCSNTPPSLTPTINLALPPSDNSCYSVVTASGCQAGESVRWYNDDEYYSSENPLTVESIAPLNLKAACFNGQKGPISNPIVTNAALYTEITPNPITICYNQNSSGTGFVNLTANLIATDASFVWKLNGNTINNSNAKIYLAAQSGQYSVEVTSPTCGTYTSATVPANNDYSSDFNITLTTPNGSGNTILSGESITLTGGCPNNGTLQWNDGSTTNSITVSPTITTNYSFVCTIGQCTFYKGIQIKVVQPIANSFDTGAGAALKFDGYDDYVLIPNSPSLTLGNALTVEAWFNPKDLNFIPIFGFLPKTIIRKQGFNAGYALYFNKNASNNSYNYSFQVRGDNVSGPNAIASIIPDMNKWVHIAGTFDGHDAKIYINGVLVSTSNYAGNLTFQFATQTILIGKSVSDGGYDLANGGAVDEVKIWDRVLTETEIKDRMCQKILPTDPLFANLKGYYTFDENTGTTVFDKSGYRNYGEHKQGLFNGQMSTNPLANPNGPQYITSGAGIAEANAFAYNGPTSTTNLNNTRGDNINIALTSGTANGLQIYNVNEPPTITTGISGLLPNNNNYFGVVIDNPSNDPLEYSAVFNYGNISGITDESNLRLYRRDNPADPTWEDSGAILDQTANTLTVTGTNTEYILGLTNSSPLPISLIKFEGKQVENSILLNWKTAKEKGFSHFEVQKSSDSKEFGTIAKIESNKTNFYSYTDNEPINSINYYKLRMVDMDGSSIYSKTIAVNFEKNGDYLSVENPIDNGVINIKTNYKNPTFTLINDLGQKSEFSQSKPSENQYLLKPKNKSIGLFYLLTQHNGKIVTTKLIMGN